jgi:hypothetical protein
MKISRVSLSNVQTQMHSGPKPAFYGLFGTTT